MNTEKSIADKAADLLMQVSFAVRDSRGRLPGVIDLEETAVALREAAAAARPVPQASSNVFMGLDQATALGLRSPVPQAGTSEPGWLERQTTAAAERAAKMPAWLTRTAPQAGEVAEIVAWLRNIGGRDPARAADLLTAQAAALAAKDAEIETLKQERRDHAGEVIFAHKRMQELEAALRPFAEVAAGETLNPLPSDWARARAALAGKTSAPRKEEQNPEEQPDA